MARSAVLSFPMVKIGTAAVTVSLDNVANDGQAGENDNARDAESIIGGAGNDVLIGNAARNTLRGLFGNDRLFARMRTTS
jgi:Ca2+-binding RTX toxin-like protein